MKKRMIRRKMRVTEVTFMAVSLEDGLTYEDVMELPFHYSNEKKLEKDLRANFDTDKRRVVIIKEHREKNVTYELDPLIFAEYADVIE